MIDIIIPAYNADKTLDRALKSIACQNIASIIHVTVVDDCSDEKYDDIVNKHKGDFASLQLIRCELNGGSGTARRIGMKHTKQPYIGFLDADDVFYDIYSVGRLYNEISGNPDCIVTMGDFLEQNHKGEFNTHQDDMVWCFSKLYRRSWLDEKGITFNDTRCNEDVGFNTKIALVKSEKDKMMAIHQPTYVWCFNHQGITKQNQYAYAFSNGIEGYVTNKIEALQFSENPIANSRHSFAVLAQLYKVYNQACYMRPEYVQHVFDQAKRFTDFMFTEPIAEYDFVNGLMPVKGEMDKMTVIPVMTVFDFCKKLGVNIETNKYHDMQYAKRIEVTTVIGCSVACANCPQAILCERYKGETVMSLDTFKKCVDNTPKDVMICFSGYAEPYLNPNCTDMILYAHEKGHQVGLYTTLQGMTMLDWQSIKHIDIAPLVIHVPTKEGQEQIFATDEYMELLKTIKPHNYSAHGEIPSYIKSVMYNSYIMGADMIHDRAGLVDNGKRQIEHNKGVFCITNMQHPVLVPNGDMYVCCQDFGLQEKTGNLLEQTYDEIMNGEKIKELRRKISCGEETICKKCIMARPTNS